MLIWPYQERYDGLIQLVLFSVNAVTGKQAAFAVRKKLEGQRKLIAVFGENRLLFVADCDNNDAFFYECIVAISKFFELLICG